MGLRLHGVPVTHRLHLLLLRVLQAVTLNQGHIHYKLLPLYNNDCIHSGRAQALLSRHQND